MSADLAPRDDLIRGMTEIRADEGDGNTMVGYPIVFNTWTEIDSWEGRFRERVLPGAVKKTLKERGDHVKVQFDHGMHPVIGSLPLGKPEVMRADDLGLWTETPLSRATDVQTLIKPRLQEGSLDGMSFRFSIIAEEWSEEPGESDENPRGLPERTIKELRLFEYGPVTWPAYEATQVGIRGQAAFQAWLNQSADERSKLMADAGLQLSREIIRIRSGAVVIDTPEPQEAPGEAPDIEARTDAGDGDTAPPEGHVEDTPAEGHESDEQRDTPAEGHESSPTTDTEADEDVKAEQRRQALAEVRAALERQPVG